LLTERITRLMTSGEYFSFSPLQTRFNLNLGGKLMAIDAYLQIDGIKGESQDSAHQGWIELTSAQWGVLQPKSATASTAGGHTAERCEHRSIAVTKLADLSSPLLMQTCSAGKTIPKAKLEFMRADSDGKPVKYYEVELENVLIGSINQAAHEGGILQDSVSLKFSKVKWKYTQQKIGGGAGGNTAGGWDLAINRIA
jgi:type VI secretion system secreted protein Hcp